LTQDAETAPRKEEIPLASLLIASSRSHEAIESKLQNEDYVAFRYDERRLALVMCDGVGQSFFGEIAARFLGERLVEWLWELPSDAAQDGKTQAERLFNDLHAWTEAATELVNRHPLPKKSKNSLLHTALERKREAGSAAVFACARIDLSEGGTSCLAFWLGNTQLRFWDGKGKELSLISDYAHNAQWSTAKGPLNSDVAHYLAMPSLAEKAVKRLMLHTDGVHQFADKLGGLTKPRLEKILRELADDPASDDVSLLDVTLKLKKATAKDA
jgi:hypothetical protein